MVTVVVAVVKLLTDKELAAIREEAEVLALGNTIWVTDKMAAAILIIKLLDQIAIKGPD